MRRDFKLGFLQSSSVGPNVVYFVPTELQIRMFSLRHVEDFFLSSYGGCCVDPPDEGSRCMRGEVIERLPSTMFEESTTIHEVPGRTIEELVNELT